MSISWLKEAVGAFGVACRAKLQGPGDREAAIRAPLEGLLAAVGKHLSVDAVFHDEVRDTQRQVRPDYGVSVRGAMTGYIEVKAPGKGIDPERFRGHDRKQWERQRDLLNLIYTNGTEWRLYRDGELVGSQIAFLGGSLDEAGASLDAPDEFEAMVTNFLKWRPAPITSVGALVRAIAPLTRLLRGEVLDQLAEERRAVTIGADRYSQPFLGLAQDWRVLLFPTADDATFADGYAQAVTFALLLARTENIDLEGQSLHEIGAALGHQHSLMGRALQLLTDDVAADFRVTLDLLVRVIGAVNWKRVRSGRRDTYLHLYEDFLEAYDNELRKKSGSYYTPREVVEEMVRLAEEALVSRLGKQQGFRDPSVFTVDPAMGTGTYLHTILERIAEQTTASDGEGAVPGALAQAAQRIAGFELQMGPYAVAELRTADLLASQGAKVPSGGLPLYVTDTLDDPYAAETQIGSGLQLIAKSRRQANEVKAKTSVTVVIGNPPYHERAEGMGGWVENGSKAHGKTRRPVLDDFRDPATARHFHNLKNLYVYFWRWATWKVWESTALDTGETDTGIVCFISTSGYVGGPGFTGMREYLRRYASEAWIIDLTPEGQTPDVPTRIFPQVRQPLAIGLFIRKPDDSRDDPAVVHYQALHGRQNEKFETLREITLDGAGWRSARTDWTAPFTPAADTDWDLFPGLADLMPWTSPGVTGNRRWPYAPSRAILETRWGRLRSEEDPRRRADLFKETRDRKLGRSFEPLPGLAEPVGDRPLSSDREPLTQVVRVGYKAFDRQWIIPDVRVLDMPRRDLWAARVPGQIFLIEQHSQPIHSGPGIVLSSLIPDLHHFNGRGGRTLPFLNPDSSPNVALGLLDALTTAYGREVTAEDLVSYLAAVVATSGFTEAFADELKTPGIRVPITADPDLFVEAVELGRTVVWVHTYGDVFTGAGRPYRSVRYPSGDERQPLSSTPITTMPTDLSYDSPTMTLKMGGGTFGPVRPEVFDYEVGGKNVIKSWVNYRKAEPGGKKSSPLDYMHVEEWDPEWTIEFIDLLTVLTRVTELDEAQKDVLARIIHGPLLTKDALTEDGVAWPASPAGRRPRFGFGVPGEQGTLAFAAPGTI